MKGQLGQEQFQKIYASKQEELVDVNAKISEAEKQNEIEPEEKMKNNEEENLEEEEEENKNV